MLICGGYKAVLFLSANLLCMQAALDRADALEAEARSAGQQRAGLIAHRDSLRAYQKASSAWDAAPNMYWDDPEALVQAALQRRAAQRKEQSASQAAPRIALPQRQRRAPQVRLPKMPATYYLQDRACPGLHACMWRRAHTLKWLCSHAKQRTSVLRGTLLSTQAAIILEHMWGKLVLYAIV